MIFYYTKSLLKIVLGQNFVQLSTDFQHFCSTFYDNLSAKFYNCLELNEIEDIQEKPLSESRNYTLDVMHFLIKYKLNFDLINSKREKVATSIF